MVFGGLMGTTSGVAAGLADGYSWQHRTIEGGQRERAFQRMISSMVLGAIAGLAAFFISSVISLSDWEELLGFIVLGGVLGILFAKVGAGVLGYALRAGAGFEAERHPNPNTPFPRINSRELRLNCLSPTAKNERGEIISGLESKFEEGISIQIQKRNCVFGQKS